MSFQQGLSGLNASSRSLDVIGNNIANATTAGFKMSRAEFADMYATALTGAVGMQVGIGTQIADVTQQFTQGNVTVTNNPLDLAISGNGFYRMNQNGVISYQRNGQFQLDKDGYIVNNTGQKLTGYQAITNTLGDLQISTASLPASATTTALLVANLDASSAVGDTDATTFNVYDSLGNLQAYSLTFTKTAANVWDVTASVTNPQGTTTSLGALGTLTFTTGGVIDTALTTLPFAESIAAADLGTGAANLNFDVDFTGTTQFGSSFGVTTAAPDGFSAGMLAGLDVGESGVIKGRYTNGQTQDLGQVALAVFANPQGLTAIGNNQWVETADSGQAMVDKPGSGTRGLLQSGAVEDANVDLTQELVALIVAQRMYQANAQTIKAQDQVLQTLVNLR
jgi:flagellar hook protein FlgE